LSSAAFEDDPAVIVVDVGEVAEHLAQVGRPLVQHSRHVSLALGVGAVTHDTVFLIDTLAGDDGFLRLIERVPAPLEGARQLALLIGLEGR